VTEQSPPYDPLGRIAGLAGDDLAAMSKVDRELEVAYWQDRHAAKAAALSDDMLTGAVGCAEESVEKVSRRSADWPYSMGLVRALKAERQRRQTKGAT
jgi:hypothetical protein